MSANDKSSTIAPQDAPISTLRPAGDTKADSTSKPTIPPVSNPNEQQQLNSRRNEADAYMQAKINQEAFYEGVNGNEKINRAKRWYRLNDEDDKDRQDVDLNSGLLMSQGSQDGLLKPGRWRQPPGNRDSDVDVVILPPDSKGVSRIKPVWAKNKILGIERSHSFSHGYDRMMSCMAAGGREDINIGWNDQVPIKARYVRELLELAHKHHLKVNMDPALIARLNADPSNKKYNDIMALYNKYSKETEAYQQGPLRGQKAAVKLKVQKAVLNSAASEGGSADSIKGMNVKDRLSAAKAVGSALDKADQVQRDISQGVQALLSEASSQSPDKIADYRNHLRNNVFGSEMELERLIKNLKDRQDVLTDLAPDASATEKEVWSLLEELRDTRLSDVDRKALQEKLSKADPEIVKAVKELDKEYTENGKRLAEVENKMSGMMDQKRSAESELNKIESATPASPGLGSTPG